MFYIFGIQNQLNRMRLTKILLLIFFASTLQLLVAQVSITKSDVIETHNGKNFYIHTVDRGQTVYSIAHAYDVTVDEVYFNNPDTKNGLSIGQSIFIPTINKETELTNEVKTAKFDFFYHVASDHETFTHISTIYLIPKKYIIKANPGIKEPLREGEYIKIPVEEAFEILDGNTQSTAKQQAAPKSNYAYNKPASTATSSKKLPTKNTVQTVTKSKSAVTPANKTTQIDSEFVTFDPDIPVIQDYRHVVIMGETTKSIAEKYNIPTKLLKAANPGLGNTVLKGDRLRVPDKKKIGELEHQRTPLEVEKKKNTKQVQTDKQNTTKETEAPKSNDNEGFINHTVKRKETLYSIGREYGLTVDEIKTANKGLTNNIRIGQIILIPKKKISKPYILHEVGKSIKVNKIARLYRIPTYQISDFNPGLGKKAYTGQEIKIPVGRKAIIVPVNEIEEEIIIEEVVEEKVVPEIRFNKCLPNPNYSKTFNVALMIPLSVEELDSLDREQFLRTRQSYFKPFRFIQFYEGLKLALDSLEKQGMNVNLYVYDVDKNISKTAKVLQQPEIRTMDLIVGPFYSASFNQVAYFAGNFNIPIVNPLSFRESILSDYNTAIKVKPGIKAQLEMTNTFVSNFAPNSKVFLISQTSYLDADLVTNIQNSLLENMDTYSKFGNYELLNLGKQVALRDTLYNPDSMPPPFTFEGSDIYPMILNSAIDDSTTINNYLIKINYSTDSLYPFLENASVLRNNIVIVYGKKKSFVLDVLNRLNETRDTFDIQLLGMPGWDRINNLNNVKMNNLNLTYFSSNYINYNSDITQDFIYKFRNTYFAEPDNYGFLGYDIGYYFLSNLFNYSDNVNSCMFNNPMNLLLSTYYFKKIENSSNYENQYWHMIKLRNMSKAKIPDYLVIPKSADNE